MTIDSTIRTALLMGLLMGLVIGVFYLVGGAKFGFFGLILGALMNFGIFWYSDKITLMMTHAKEADPVQYSRLHDIVSRISIRAGIPKPRVYVVDNPTLNAFATGRGPGHAAVAVHTGMLQTMTDEEIEGVLGHEITHIKNRDVLISTIAAVIAGSLSYLTYALWFGGDREDRNPILTVIVIILAPIAAMLIQMAISRSREFVADSGGAELSNPIWLASALGKISNSVERNPMREGNPATAHMYIINPFRGIKFASLFSTHPPTEERIRRLRGMVS